MTVTGLITEYNPFHNGHLLHLEKARELTRADYIIVAMSGDYVQRGTPAIIDKYLRCEMALKAGADLVLLLPSAYSAASAEYFSMGAVTLLDQLGLVDYLVFGSECGDMALLSKIALLLNEESPAFSETLKKELKSGLTYPAARSRAFQKAAGSLGDAGSLPGILEKPNNILGIEYLKALNRRNSPIRPVTIQREHSGYHETSLTCTISSASAIRKALLSGSRPKELRPFLPDPAFEILKREYGKTCPILPNDFSLPLYYELSTLKSQGLPLSRYQDVSPDLGLRIYNQLSSFRSFEEFAMQIKPRQFTYTRICRSLLNILLHMEKSHYQDYSAQDYMGYIRILGFRRKSAPLLAALKKSARLPIINKMADAKVSLTPLGKSLFFQDIFASDLYRKIQELKFQVSLPDEYRKGLIIY